VVVVTNDCHQLIVLDRQPDVERPRSSAVTKCVRRGLHHGGNDVVDAVLVAREVSKILPKTRASAQETGGIVREADFEPRKGPDSPASVSLTVLQESRLGRIPSMGHDRDEARWHGDERSTSGPLADRDLRRA
jgi:hypothetical protein